MRRRSPTGIHRCSDCAMMRGTGWLRGAGSHSSWRADTHLSPVGISSNVTSLLRHGRVGNAVAGGPPVTPCPLGSAHSRAEGRSLHCAGLVHSTVIAASLQIGHLRQCDDASSSRSVHIVHEMACEHGRRRTLRGCDMQMAQSPLVSSSSSPLVARLTMVMSCSGDEVDTPDCWKRLNRSCARSSRRAARAVAPPRSPSVTPRTTCGGFLTCCSGSDVNLLLLGKEYERPSASSMTGLPKGSRERALRTANFIRLVYKRRKYWCPTNQVLSSLILSKECGG